MKNRKVSIYELVGYLYLYILPGDHRNQGPLLSAIPSPPTVECLHQDGGQLIVTNTKGLLCRCQLVIAVSLWSDSLN